MSLVGCTALRTTTTVGKCAKQKWSGSRYDFGKGRSGEQVCLVRSNVREIPKQRIREMHGRGWSRFHDGLYASPAHCTQVIDRTHGNASLLLCVVLAQKFVSMGCLNGRLMHILQRKRIKAGV